MAGVVNGIADEAHTTASMATSSMEIGTSGGAQTHDGHVHGKNTAGPQEHIPDFEAMIRDIDDAINKDSVFSFSNTHKLDSSLAMIGNDQHVGIKGDTTRIEIPCNT